MATIHLGRLAGPVGFARTVAIKRLHPPFAKDPEFVSMFLDEARLASRVVHPNVVSTLDVVSEDGEIFLVMEYVPGESLAQLLKAAPDSRVPPSLATAVMMGVLHGLHAAHEATREDGRAMFMVHRDVSPQNILVGTDGLARVLDFGIAKATARLQVTQEGQLKGKLGYMAPEQLEGQLVDRRTDVYAVGVVLWEALTGLRLFYGKDGAAILSTSARAAIAPPSQVAPGVPPELDPIVLKALSFRREDRYASARDMAMALEATNLLAYPREVGEWVERTASVAIERRSEALARLEETRISSSRILVGGAPPPATVPTRSFARPRMVSGEIRSPWWKRWRSRLDSYWAILFALLALLTSASFFRLQSGWKSRGEAAPIAFTAGEPKAFALPFGTTEPKAPSVDAPSRGIPNVRVDELAQVPLEANDAGSTAIEAPRNEATPGHAMMARPAVKLGGNRGHGRSRTGRTKSKNDGESAFVEGRPTTDCNPPYTVDEEGIRIPKRQCL